VAVHEVRKTKVSLLLTGIKPYTTGPNLGFFKELKRYKWPKKKRIDQRVKLWHIDIDINSERSIE